MEVEDRTESSQFLIKTWSFLLTIQFGSVAQSFPTLQDPMDHSTPGLPVHHHLSESIQTHVHWVGDAIQPSQPLSSPPLPAFCLSQHQGLFQWVSSSHQVAKVLEFQLQHQPFQWKHRTDLLQVGLGGSPCNPRDSQESSPMPQFKSINSSVLNFYIVQLSHPFMTTGKTIALTRWTFVGKVKSLLFNMLSRLVITFLPRSKHLLISWLQSPSAVILVTIPILKLSKSPRNIVLEWKRILSCVTINSKDFSVLISEIKNKAQVSFYDIILWHEI